MFTDDFYMASATIWYFSTTWLEKKSWYVRKKWPIFAFFGKFSSHFVSRFFYSSSRFLKPLLFHTKNICGQYKTIFTQFKSIPFSLDGPPIRSFLSKSWNGDYVIRDDVIGYPDIATDSNWPNEHAGIISFYQLWHRKIGRSLARVSLRDEFWMTWTYSWIPWYDKGFICTIPTINFSRRVPQSGQTFSASIGPWHW